MSDETAIKDSNRTEKTFSDIPFEILAKVVEKLDFKSQTKLQRVSRDLKKIVDRSKPPIDGILYHIKDNIKVTFFCTNTYLHLSVQYTGYNKERVFNDLAILLNNPRLRLKRFRWVNESSTPELDQKLIDLMNSLDRKLEVSSLQLDSQLNEDLHIAVLQTVKPKTLETMQFHFPNQLINIDRLFHLDQWKKAKIVYLKDIKLDFSRAFHHFHQFKFIVVRAEAISIDDMLNMRKASF
uniref:F-box domain-containing protein n=1 Tax=Caenorhabditis tropicalis TaxID=1561998 RepID=A0A1I7UWT7_9PELO